MTVLAFYLFLLKYIFLFSLYIFYCFFISYYSIFIESFYGYLKLLLVYNGCK